MPEVKPLLKFPLVEVLEMLEQGLDVKEATRPFLRGTNLLFSNGELLDDQEGFE